MKPAQILFLTALLCGWSISIPLVAQQDASPTPTGDSVRQMQFKAADSKTADWGHWGTKPDKFSSWTNHSNRLIPIYTFGINLSSFIDSNSIYQDEKRLTELYGRLPEMSTHPKASYMDQTDVYHLQKQAIEDGKKYIFLIVFDGMDWQTTRAAAIYRNRDDVYESGKGSGLAFQDYDKVENDFGFFVCSPLVTSVTENVNGQIVEQKDNVKYGGYNPLLGGFHPWDKPASYPYLISQDRALPHAYTDSASSATSMTAGVKTYNGSINVSVDGEKFTPIARWLQSERQFAIGVVSSVPFCHATPAATYANNVSRSDYQDISRDLLGISSVANRRPLAGMDVVIGAGWNEIRDDESQVKSARSEQGSNYVPGNRYLADDDLARIDVENGGLYQTAIRSDGKPGKELLHSAADRAVSKNQRLFGLSLIHI